MRIIKNLILTLFIINFLTLCDIEKINAASYFLPRKQANIAFVGFSNSGKTALMHKLAEIPFDFYYCVTHTIEDRMIPKSLLVNDGEGQDYAIDCKLWDLPGHPKEKDRIINYICKYMDVVVIMVSLGMSEWRDEVSRNVQEWKRKILDVNPNAKIILACTKSDLIEDPNLLREIETDMDIFTSIEGNAKSVVVSARTEYNLDSLIHLVEDAIREFGINNLKEIGKKLPFESSGSCLLL